MTYRWYLCDKLTRWSAPLVVLLSSLLSLTIISPASGGETKNKYSRPFLIKKMEFQEINTWYYLYLRENLKVATQKKADLIILEIDSPGGEVHTALKIINRLQKINADLVIYINDNAISAGALISLVSPVIYMNEAGVIGASTPVFIKDGEMKKAPEKSVSVMRSKFRSLAEKNKRPISVCEAMVDEDIRLTKKRHGINLKKGKLLTLTQKESLRLGVVDKQATSLEAVFNDLQIDPKKVESYEITASLIILDFFSKPVILGILMTIGLFGLIFEVKTPGWGVGGTVGILSLASFFLIQIFLGNTDWQMPLLFAIGVLLIGVEIFIIPGFGVTGVLGFICILASLFLSFNINNWETGLNVMTLSLLTTIVFFLLSLKFIPNLNFFRSISLEASILSQTPRNENKIKKGMQGKSITALRPVGKANIDGEVVEVMTQGDFIAISTGIEVVKISSNQIIVKQKSEST